MIKYTDLIKQVNEILKKYYPIKKTFDDINQLSHFWLSLTEKQKLPFQFDIDGNITSGIYKSYKIIKVTTIKEYTWRKYLSLYMSFTNLYFYNRIHLLIQSKNKIDILHINNLTIQKDNKIIKIDAEYILTADNYINLIYPPKINKTNHFYFSSFNIDKNKQY